MTQVLEAQPDLRYPVGPFHAHGSLTAADHARLIDEIAALPAALRAAVAGLSQEQLDTPYRPGGWTIRQVVHHVPDSHMNSYVRFKLAVTEQEPLIRTYDEAAWAELADGRHADVALSLDLLDVLHRRWTLFLRSLDDAQFARTVRHPEMGVLTLSALLQLYAWHGRHHHAHIAELKRRMNW